MNAALEGLDQVPWGRLRHAYGSARDVPELIRELASLDPEVRGHAHYWLSGNLFHQGTLYSATAFAVPFLVELATTPGVPERDWIVTYLNGLTLSEHTRWLFDGFDVDHPRMRNWFRGRGSAPFKASYEAVVRELDRLLGLLGDAEAKVRTAAAFTLAFFGPEAAKVAGRARLALAGEREERVRASLRLCLALQGVYLESDADLERIRPGLDEAGREARILTAIALATLPGGHLDDAGFALLREAALTTGAPTATPAMSWSLTRGDGTVQTPEPEPAPEAGGADPFATWQDFPWNDGDLRGYAFQAAVREEARRPEAVLALMFDVVETGSPLAREAGPMLFLRAFEVPPGSPTLEGLTPLQRRYLEAMARHRALCSGAFFEALEAHGLPGDYEPLREMLGLPSTRVPTVLDRRLPGAVAGDERPLRSLINAALEGGEPSLEALAAAIAAMPPADALQAAVQLTIDERLLGDTTDVAFAVVEGAAQRDPEGLLVAARARAADYARNGPPISYGKWGLTQHNPVLGLVMEAAREACLRLARVPDEVFDAMPTRLAGSGFWQPRIRAYLSLLPPPRREAFLLTGLNESFDATLALVPAGPTPLVVQAVVDGVLQRLDEGWDADLEEHAHHLARFGIQRIGPAVARLLEDPRRASRVLAVTVLEHLRPSRRRAELARAALATEKSRPLRKALRVIAEA